MRKIPTLFVRDPETNFRYVSEDVNPEARWVIEGEGTPTRKYDGTCVLYHDMQWFARREVKPGKDAPPNFVPIETDEATGKTVGWEPIEQSGFVKFFNEALKDEFWEPGTFELLGPKINGNPEGCTSHVLVRHADAEVLGAPRSFAELRQWLQAFDGEGIVWHHPDGRMAKLKHKDFPRATQETDPVQHDHRERVEGCFRCDLSAQETDPG